MIRSTTSYPGLMAAFQLGVSQAAEEESPARTDSTR
jgi:hypothetical protein